VLTLLDEISKSEFVTTTHESFREIQEDWHREIEEMFDELRTKEKVISQLPSAATVDVFYLRQVAWLWERGYHTII